MKPLIFVLLFVVSACSAGEPLPPIQGPWQALNSDHWKPSAGELQTIQGLPER